jgi:hypothetical protein
MSRRLVAALFLCWLTACDVGTKDPDEVAVAYLDGQPQSLAVLQSYLRSNLIADETDDPDRDSEADVVKSRLFDAFIEERLLLMEAERRGVAVSDREIEAWIGVANVDGESAITGSRWAEERRRLMIHKLQQRLAEAAPPIADEVVLAYVAQHHESLMPPRRLILRALPLESAEEAQRVRREIARGRLTFEEAVVRYGTFPGLGQPIEVTWRNLPEAQREALEGLKADRVSEPVPMSGEVFLFQVQSWLQDTEQLEQIAQAAARAALESERREEIFRSLLVELKEKTEIEVKPRRLPFDYVPDGRG